MVTEGTVTEGTKVTEGTSPLCILINHINNIFYKTTIDCWSSQHTVNKHMTYRKLFVYLYCRQVSNGRDNNRTRKKIKTIDLPFLLKYTIEEKKLYGWRENGL